MAAAKAKQNFVSFKLEDFAAGAVVPAGDYLIKAAQFKKFDYGGKRPDLPANLAFTPTYQAANVNGNSFELLAQEYEQSYTIGGTLADFVASDSGYNIVPVSGKALGAGSNFHIWLTHALQNGFPEDLFDNDSSVFEGYLVRIEHVAPPESRNNMQSNINPTAGTGTANRKPNTIAVITWVYKTPEEKKISNPRQGGTGSTAAPKAGAAGKPAAAPAKKGAATSDFDAEGKMADMLNGVIEEKGVPVARTQVRLALFKATNGEEGMDADQKKEVMDAFGNEELLTNTLAALGYAVNGSNIVAV